MSEPEISLSLHGDRRWYRPGDVLSGEYRLVAAGGDDFKAVEVSVLWHTEGQGDEDMAVHFFQRFDREVDGVAEPLDARRFSTALPRSPLSYDGVIVKVRWCARVRAFPRRGRELVAEAQFRLGNVPPAHVTPEVEVV